MYQKILVPLDGSDLAECTLAHVESLAMRGFAGEVTLLNIVEVGIPVNKLFDSKHYMAKVKYDLDGLREHCFAASRSYLQEKEADLAAKGIRVKAETVEANRPATAIIEYAQREGMDLIVMATHGHSGLQKLMPGSVAFGVLHESPLPVLLVRPKVCRP